MKTAICLLLICVGVLAFEEAKLNRVAFRKLRELASGDVTGDVTQQRSPRLMETSVCNIVKIALSMHYNNIMGEYGNDLTREGIAGLKAGMSYFLDYLKLVRAKKETETDEELLPQLEDLEMFIVDRIGGLAYQIETNCETIASQSCTSYAQCNNEYGCMCYFDTAEPICMAKIKSY